MPKIADHPRASLARTLELAAAVEELGGECSLGAAAARLGSKPGGTFGAVVSTAAKYGWIAIRRSRLRAEARYRDYRLAYDEAERRATLLEAMRAVPLFRQLLDRFGGKTLPEDHLPQLLAREFDVPESSAGRVAGYFVEAALAAGLLAGTQLRATPTGIPPAAVGGGPRMASTLERRTRTGSAPHTSSATASAHGRPRSTAGSRSARDAGDPGRDDLDRPSMDDTATLAPYRIRISGPDVDSTFDLTEPDDLELVRAVLAKVERGLRARRRSWNA